MTWMLIRLVLSLAFVGGILWFAARVAKKRGLGGGNQGLIEVVARQRMGRSSTVNVVRIGDVVLVVGATEEQITLLAEIDNDTLDPAPREEIRVPAPRRQELPRFQGPPRAERLPLSDDYAGDGYAQEYAQDYAEPGYAADGYDGEAYASHGFESHGFEGAGYEGAGYADHGYADEPPARVERRPAAHSAERPRHSTAQHSTAQHSPAQHSPAPHSPAPRRPAAAPQTGSGPLAGSVFDKDGWGGFVNELRERTVRRP